MTLRPWRPAWGEQVVHHVRTAALPRGVEHFGDGSFQAGMGIGDDEFDAARAAAGQAAQEFGPEGFGLRGADRQPQNLTPAIGVDAGLDGDGDRDNAAGLADIEAGGAQPDIGPFVLQRAVQKVVDFIIDLAEQP